MDNETNQCDFPEIGGTVNTALGTNVTDMSVYGYANRSVQPSASWKNFVLKMNYEISNS